MSAYGIQLKIAVLLAGVGVCLTGCVTNPMTAAKPTVTNTMPNQLLANYDQARGDISTNNRDAVNQHNRRTEDTVTRGKSDGRSTAGRPEPAYQNPELSAIDIIYLGAGSFTRETTNVVREEFEMEIFNDLGSDAGKAELGEIVRGFFKRLGTKNPQLRLRILGADEKQIVGDSINSTAFATIAFNRAVLFETAFKSGAKDRTLYVSVPLFLVAAKTYQIIYTRPLFVRVRLEEGVSYRDPKIVQRILAEIREALESSTEDTQSLALMTNALKRGTFSDPSRLVYGIDDGGVTFSDAAASAQAGFKDTQKVAAVLREAASGYLAYAQNVFPPIDAQLSSKLYREMGARYYGLEVVTDMMKPKGFPQSEPGRIILPISRVSEDINLGIQVKTGTQIKEQGAQFKSGICQVVLEVAERNSQNLVLQKHQVVQNGGFQAHVNQIGREDEECLMETLLACAHEFKGGLK